jgi:hypothetical protein
MENDEIGFLLRHMTHLTQSISHPSLPLSREGSRPRLWQFWQRFDTWMKKRNFVRAVGAGFGKIIAHIAVMSIHRKKVVTLRGGRGLGQKSGTQILWWLPLLGLLF